jgi:lipoic acid synthetase
VSTAKGIKLEKPAWLKVKSGASKEFAETFSVIRKYKVATVCEEALCPNIGECWRNKTATFIIMGYTCTRHCGFCGIRSGTPNPIDPKEPENVAMAVRDLGIKYTVITTVARDDLPDCGASHFAAVVAKTKELSPCIKIETLGPDFWANKDHIAKMIEVKPDVYGHNIEVGRRMFHAIKNEPSDYDVSLKSLKIAKELNPKIITKSGMMVGVGETFDEVIEIFEDLRRVDVDIVIVGQYLSPSASHYPVVKYVSEDEFEKYREKGLELGFKEVISGPLVRSSYRAGEVYSSLCVRF